MPEGGLPAGSASQRAMEGSASDAEEPQAAHGPAGSGSRKTAPVQCCTQANKPLGRGRVAGHPGRVLRSLDLNLQTALVTVLLCSR